MSELELYYTKPANAWTEALPLGNGRLGAMVFGDISRERLQLNESSFFTGGPYQPVNPEARQYLPKVRELILAGRFAEAEAMAHDHMMARPYLQTSYQPIGDIWIQFHHQMNTLNYRRSLDLDSAIATTSYVAGGVTYTRECFISAASGVLAFGISADRAGSISVDLALSSPQPGAPIPGTLHQLGYRGTNRPEHGIAAALRFGVALRVTSEGGQRSLGPETLRVQQADRVMILADAATSFRRFDDVSGDPDADIARRLDAASASGWEVLKRDHLAEHRRLFRVLDLRLGASTAPPRPTDERVKSYPKDEDPALAALFAQYGRYLMISSSRPGTQPANLQGLWNEELRPSWGSKYTANINLEMNYWLPDPANLGECFEPLIALCEDLVVTGAVMAREHYGARGWVLHHNTDLWRATGPVDGPQWGLWPMGGGWLCAQLWDHYQFFPDAGLLARIYPLLKGAVEFMLDYLVEEPGTGALVTVPSLSPENRHPHGASLCAGPAMDNQILRDLFDSFTTAARLLGADTELCRSVRAVRERLHPDQVGAAGQLQEWRDDWDLDVPEPQHRHVSHLYGLYPSLQIDPRTTQQLAEGARRSLELRGDDATGWGIGWRLNLWARLRDGDHAAAILRLLLAPQRTYPNLFDAHPPFQIDGNFGGAAGIIEMLVQSRPGRVDLLPALPANWREGSIHGVRLRGGAALDMIWTSPDAVLATLRADHPWRGFVALGDRDSSVDLAAGESITLHLSRVPAATTAGR